MAIASSSDWYAKLLLTVIAGFTRDREVRERRVGVTGGWFGRSTVVTRKRIELMILLTPRIQ